MIVNCEYLWSSGAHNQKDCKLTLSDTIYCFTITGSTIVYTIIWLQG